VAREKRAELTISLERSARGSPVLLVDNGKGKSEARDVRINIDGTPLREHPLYYPPVGQEREDEVVVEVISRGGYRDIVITTAGRVRFPVVAEVIWNDDYASDRSIRQELTF